jgi:hypothetical protein
MEPGFDHSLNGMGLLNFDYDNDGAQDSVMTTISDEMRFYQNDLTSGGANWESIDLDTSGHENLAPNGVGSRVQVSAVDRTYNR